MNVVIVTDSAAVDGGVSQVTISSAVHLDALGVKVAYFAATGPIDERLAARPSIDVLCLGLKDIKSEPNRLRAMTQGLANSAAAAALRRFLERYPVAETVVHIHSWSKALSAAVIAMADELGYRFVVSLHEYFLACPNGAFFVFNRNEVCERRPLSVSCVTCNCDSRQYAHKLWRVARAVVHRTHYRVPQRATHYISVSPFSEQIMRPHLPPKAKIKMIRYPVVVAPQAPTVPSQAKAYLFVGRFSREKGIEVFAEAARLAGVPAVFVGDGHLLQSIRAQYPEFAFLGWLSSGRVVEEMRKARMLVFPSMWYETQGLTVIEAAANGLPSLISDCTAAAADLPDGTSSLHIKHGDVESLAKALRRTSNDALVDRLGAAAYDWYWRDPWTEEVHARRLKDYYENLQAGREDLLGPPAARTT